MIWLKTLWVWLKANWKAVLIGLFTLGIGLLVGKVLRKPQKVINPELVRAGKTKREAQAEEDKARLKAKKERDEKVMEVGRNHLETVMKLTDEQKTKARELVDDPDELNEYLLNVGKEIRN